MAWSKTAVTYGYKIEISLESIINKICENIIDQPDDWEFDGEKLIIRGSIHTGANIWSCRATMEDPEEHEVELDKNIEEEDIDAVVYDVLKQVVPEMIHTNVEIDDESDWEVPEPYDPRYDDNDAYDRWRDRQWEE